MLWMVGEWPPFRWLQSACFWAMRPRLLRLRLADAMALRRSRLKLATLAGGTTGQRRAVALGVGRASHRCGWIPGLVQPADTSRWSRGGRHLHRTRLRG